MPEKSEKPGRGRPRFKPTPAMRRDVSIAAGGGMRHQDIALALGISDETLRKYFDRELSIGAAQRRMEALKGLHKGAKRGSSSAAKEYLKGDPEAFAPPPEAPAKPGRGVATEPKLGKKEQAEADARVAGQGGEWGDLLPGAPAGSNGLH